jgi:hypothetical protein
MTLSPRLPPGLACDPAGSGPGSAALRRMMELALRRGARSVAVGGGHFSHRREPPDVLGGHELDRNPAGVRRS